MNRFIKRNLRKCGLETVDQDDTHRSMLPDGFCETVIEGGCHAYFGVYGEQEGDGTPTLSVTKQIDLSAEYITSFILTED